MLIYQVVAISRMSDGQTLADQLQVTLHKVRVHLASARFGASWEIKFSRLQLLFANQTLFFVREPIFWGQRAVLKLFPRQSLPKFPLPKFWWRWMKQSELAEAQTCPVVAVSLNLRTDLMMCSHGIMHKSKEWLLPNKSPNMRTRHGRGENLQVSLKQIKYMFLHSR